MDGKHGVNKDVHSILCVKEEKVVMSNNDMEVV